MYVIKESGQKEKLNFYKIKTSIMFAGGSESLANKAVREVREKAYPGMRTRDILHMVLGILREEPGIAQRYSLKRAIMMLGPTGFPFEKFVARVLREYGYKTKTDMFVAGKCVVQEVDVLAVKDGKKYMVECKYHNSPGNRTDLKVAMYTHARFLDIQHKGFVQSWLVTNTKCTSEAEIYARCNGIKVISWNYPPNEGLEKMLMQKNLYPITSLESLTLKIRERLVGANLMLVSDLLTNSMFYLRMKTRMPTKILENLREEAQHILQLKDEKVVGKVV
ncbi:MAG: restriction endonuclease [Nanoarchaeota archaeon]|nr:restriction endonuclease [Nanoarchaeota archaeon]